MAKVVNIKASRSRSGRGSDARTALVLAGGGITGAVYQIGALRALDLLAVDMSVNDFDIYVGTSCGAYVSALIANGCRPEDLMRAIDGQMVEGLESIDFRQLMRPNYREIAQRASRLPFRVPGLLKDITLNARNLSLVDMLTMVADLAPGGFYSLDSMTGMLTDQLNRSHFTNDFRELEKELYIVATDLDTCEPVVFGESEWADVPIAKAAAASAALPIVFNGVDIRGREFVDGGLRSFANVDTAIAHGAKLVVIINPIVPFDNERLSPWMGKRPRRISEGGLTAVASQILKCLVWSSMHERLDHWRTNYPGVDFILIEPRRDDALMFQTQVMNVSERVEIARHGFESVVVHLADDFERLRETCAKHSINISRRNVIAELDLSRRGAVSGTTRWRRILERRTAATGGR